MNYCIMTTDDHRKSTRHQTIRLLVKSQDYYVQFSTTFQAKKFLWTFYYGVKNPHMVFWFHRWVRQHWTWIRVSCVNHWTTIIKQAAHGLWSLAGLKVPIHAQFGMVTPTSFLVCDLGSLVGLDYKSLCAAVMICATLINIQTQSTVGILCENVGQLS